LKIAIIGANGQVGAELCLMLAAKGSLELVPICRNRSGSAFLRWQGIACRHGRAADPKDAPRLLADCDIIVNSSLASGSPAQIRRIEDQIAQNIFACSKRSAIIIHFSTQSVYGDPRPGHWIRWRNPYGRAKLATERRVRTAQRRYGKAAYILRLGHVCGPMQQITHDIRTDIRAKRVIFPGQNHSSNTVYTFAIVAAITQIIRGGVKPDTYDLMNSPPWGWREVYEYEAQAVDTPLSAAVVASGPRSAPVAVLAPMLRVAAALISAEPVRNAVAKIFAYVPDRTNTRALAWWYKRRARSEISALNAAPAPPQHLAWLPNGVHFFPADQPTMELMPSGTPDATVRKDLKSWPPDLPDAAAGPT